MRAVLLGFGASLAATTLPAVPAEAVQASAGQPAASFGGGFATGRDHRDGRRHHRDFRHRNFGGFDGVIAYDRDYQGDTAWRSNGFNDWWHNRPDRSYPRWVQDNQSCERKWWSGSGWRC
jgi:hypothetical protein